MFSNFTNYKVAYVTIVDPNPLVLTKWKNLLRRNDLNHRIRWTYYEDFAEYIDDIGA